MGAEGNVDADGMIAAHNVVNTMPQDGFKPVANVGQAGRSGLTVPDGKPGQNQGDGVSDVAASALAVMESTRRPC